jgi:hypothetical protein
MTKKIRSDAGKKRVSYLINHDKRGMAGKENLLLKSFWSKYNMDEALTLTPEELDIKIAAWLEEFETAQRKRHKFWTWPHYPDPRPKVKKEKGKVNIAFNSSFPIQ